MDGTWEIKYPDQAPSNSVVLVFHGRGEEQIFDMRKYSGLAAIMPSDTDGDQHLEVFGLTSVKLGIYGDQTICGNCIWHTEKIETLTTAYGTLETCII